MRGAKRAFKYSGLSFILTEAHDGFHRSQLDFVRTQPQITDLANCKRTRCNEAHLGGVQDSLGVGGAKDEQPNQ